MLSARFLLDNKLKSMSKKKKRNFLLNCIEKNNAIRLESIKSTETQQITDYTTYKNITCKVCNESEFIRDNYSETCKNCGYTRDITPTGKTFEKISYIKPGANIVKIQKDSKTITVDLNKINQWLQDVDPLASDTQKIINNLTIIFQDRGIDLPINVKNTSISLWYNFNTLYDKSKSSTDKYYNKNSILALCIYYGALIHNFTLSLEQLSLLFKINVSNIINTNILFKEVFKDSDYNKYLILNNKPGCNIKLSPKNKIIYEKIKKDLIENFPSIKEPLQNKESSAIIYYITNKINTSIKYTLKELEEKCNVSTTSISTVNKAIEGFYKKNLSLYKQLLI